MTRPQKKGVKKIRSEDTKGKIAYSEAGGQFLAFFGVLVFLLHFLSKPAPDLLRGKSRKEKQEG